jgi:hypothetical protein
LKEEDKKLNMEKKIRAIKNLETACSVLREVNQSLTTDEQFKSCINESFSSLTFSDPTKLSSAFHFVLLAIAKNDVWSAIFRNVDGMKRDIGNVKKYLAEHNILKLLLVKDESKLRDESDGKQMYFLFGKSGDSPSTWIHKNGIGESGLSDGTSRFDTLPFLTGFGSKENNLLGTGSNQGVCTMNRVCATEQLFQKLLSQESGNVCGLEFREVEKTNFKLSKETLSYDQTIKNAVNAIGATLRGIWMCNFCVNAIAAVSIELVGVSDDNILDYLQDADTDSSSISMLNWCAAFFGDHPVSANNSITNYFKPIVSNLEKD